MNEKKCCCKGVKCLCNIPCETKLLYVLVILLFVLGGSCCFTFNKKMKKWVDKNPKAILDSVQIYVESQQADAQQKQQKDSVVLVKENINEIRSEKNSGVLNPNGKKIIVEFYDYNCGYCKMASKNTMEVAKDKNIKVIFKDLPILSDASNVAAKYSIAVSMVEGEKFADFHHNLFEGNPKSVEGIRAALRQSKISVEKIEKILKSREAEIEETLNATRNLAIKIGLQGTPAYVIGETLVPGYIEIPQMLELLKK